jgi:Flp pilus assembly protein TadD
MPAAIPIAAAVIPSVIGAVISNGQNKANTANATNAANTSRSSDAQALQQALANYQQYVSNNPSPASQSALIAKAPNTYGQSSGSMTAPTQSINGGPNPQAVLSMISALSGSSPTAPGAQPALPGTATSAMGARV